MELYLSMPEGQLVLLIGAFIIVGFVVIGIGYWLQRYDNTGQYRTPLPCSLGILETAALQGGHHRVIHTALLKLWVSEAIDIQGQAKDAQIYIKDTKPRLNHEIERILYRYIADTNNHPCRPQHFFKTDTILQKQLSYELKAMYLGLERQHLRCTNDMYQGRKRIAHFIFAGLLVFGSFIFIFSLSHGLLLIALLVIIISMLMGVKSVLFNPHEKTVLGQRYIEQCQDQLNKSNVIKGEEDSLWRVAVFGVAELSRWQIFDPYFYAFSHTSMKRGEHMPSGCGGCALGGCGT
ncbi:TIGR04222 domain-containing membrane protein [Candidatus Albibeggiatoa sp. nov. NOAA]|uniref:TIGR04222 domain-containing membrane protein n=1 Tax=Candidatus Albibeggiatoa sp. nov. NOAA TaxID=3162724 RepID=UPI003302A5B4|nr:TIGR04222 domain-containing membrane protein [Thiotrichaceae bacterium]